MFFKSLKQIYCEVYTEELDNKKAPELQGL